MMATERLLPGFNSHLRTGVADVESDAEVSIRPMAATGGRPLEYDYGVRGSHVYEDLPPKYIPGSEDSLQRERTGPPPVEQSSWPSTISTSTSQLSHNNNNPTDSVRKRHNPLYDAVQKQHPAPPLPQASTVISPAHKASSRRILCLCVCAVAAFIIALISLVIAIYIFITITPEKYAETNQAHVAQYERLKTDFDDLSVKYSRLSALLLGDGGNDFNTSLAVLVVKNQMVLQALRSNVTEQQGAVEILESQVSVISDLKKELTSQEDSLSKNSGLVNMAIRNITSINKELNGLEESVRNVSKMEGPQGPQGVGNLSACYYVQNSKILQNAVATPSKTTKQPSLEILQNFVVMSATCSVTGGAATSLETSPVDGIMNAYQYRCQCAGTDRNIPDRTCYIHLWLCPRLS